MFNINAISKIKLLLVNYLIGRFFVIYYATFCIVAKVNIYVYNCNILDYNILFWTMILWTRGRTQTGREYVKLEYTKRRASINITRYYDFRVSSCYYNTIKETSNQGVTSRTRMQNSQNAGA